MWSDGGKNKTIMPGSRFHLMDNAAAAAAALWCRELVRKSAECRDRLHGLLFKPIFRSASVFGETKVADIETGRARAPEAYFSTGALESLPHCDQHRTNTLTFG